MMAMVLNSMLSWNPSDVGVMLKSCVVCGGLFSGVGSRCQKHKPAGQTYAERITMQLLRAAWVQDHGLVCPGWHRAQHTVNNIRDLTGDHILPQNHGGRYGALRVLCLSCNSTRQDRLR